MYKQNDIMYEQDNIKCTQDDNVCEQKHTATLVILNTNNLTTINNTANYKVKPIEAELSSELLIKMSLNIRKPMFNVL